MSELAERFQSFDPANLSPEELVSIGQEIGFVSIPGFTNVPAAQLLGVPFIITGVRYQAPVVDKNRPSGFRDYVTFECTAGSESAIQDELTAGRIVVGYGPTAQALDSLSDLPVKPGERFIVNDGSTGARRTITRIFHALGLITVADGEFDKNDMTPFDLPSNKWVKWDTEQTWTTAKGEDLPYFTRRPDGAPFLMFAKRGMHASWFVNDETGPQGAITYYL